MRILITGATGFIGSNLVRYLASLNKYKVFVLVRKESNLNLLGPVRNKVVIVKASAAMGSINRAVCLSKPDVVVHLAALARVEHSPVDIKPLVNSNILFPTMLLEAMLKNKVKFLINTGSFWEHCENKQEYSPFNLYAATKSAFEIILKYYAEAKRIRCLTLKLQGTYGPGDPRLKIFSLFKKSLAVKEPVLFSPGGQRLDIVYIDDVVDAYEKAIRYVYKKQGLPFEILSIGSGNRGVKLRDIAGIYEKCSGRKLNIKWSGLPYRAREIMDSHSDIGPAKRKLNWSPKYNLKNGISKMLKAEGKI